MVYSLGHLAPVPLLRQSGGKRPQSGKGSQQKKLSQQLYEGVLVLGGMQSAWNSMGIFLFVRFSTKVSSCFAAISYFFLKPAVTSSTAAACLPLFTSCTEFTGLTECFLWAGTGGGAGRPL